jgi:hypothetical protein
VSEFRGRFFISKKNVNFESKAQQKLNDPRNFKMRLDPVIDETIHKLSIPILSKNIFTARVKSIKHKMEDRNARGSSKSLEPIN